MSEQFAVCRIHCQNLIFCMYTVDKFLYRRIHLPHVTAFYLFVFVVFMCSAGGPAPTVRRRSSSMGLSPEDEIPAVMQIIGAMNDFGLGLISWW